MGHVRIILSVMSLLVISLFKDTMFYINGLGSFGMPAENAAKQNNLDPKKWTESDILNMKVN